MTLELLGQTRGGDNVYFMPVEDDTFVHFTVSRAIADKIVSDRKLLLDPPQRAGPGDYTVNAISLTYGVIVPGVQFRDRAIADLYAVEFTTSTSPKIGFVEEVKWSRDVKLKTARVVPTKAAIRKINGSPKTIDEMDVVYYDEGLALRAVGVTESVDLLLSRLSALLNTEAQS